MIEPENHRAQRFEKKKKEMIKMKKRALGIILSVLCVLLLFSACGGKDKKEKKKSDEAKVKVEKEESEEKEDDDTEMSVGEIDVVEKLM